MQMETFKIYTDDHSFEVIVTAKGMNEALDIAATKRGPYCDHADMCAELGIEESDLNIVVVEK